MTDPGLVSVILPNRDHATFLPNALNAFLNQTWTHHEIIVIDDASSDESRDIVQAFAAKDPRVRLLILPSHQGINRAVQHALGHARGEYVHVAGADDLVQPHFFEKCVTQLIRFPDAALCFSDPSEFYLERNLLIRFPLYLSKESVHLGKDDLVALLSKNYFHISANTAVYRLHKFRAAGGYRAELGWLSDWFVTIVLALRHGACYVPTSLTQVSIRSNSYSAINLSNADAQRRYVDNVVELLLTPEYADVVSVMRQAALLPEYHFRTMLWLLASRHGRTFITIRLIARILARAPWSVLRPYAPVSLRRKLRACWNALRR